jgi:hypothetical protein
MLKSKKLWLLGLLISVLLAACGGNAPAATAEAVTQNFETAAVGGKVTLNYPAGWVTTVNNGQITVANSQAAIDAASPASGQFKIKLVVGPIAAVSGLGEDSTSQQIIKFFAAPIGISFSEPTDLSIGSFTASRVGGSLSDGQATITAVDMGGGIYDVASAVSAPNEMNQFEATLNAILATVTYTPDHPADTPLDTPAATTEASG